MKRIRTVTYCTWTSIGSILQAYALKTVNYHNGIESIIMMDRKENRFSSIKPHSFKSLLARIFQQLIHAKRKSAFTKRMRFIEANINMQYCADYLAFEKEAKQNAIEIYLAGSDQIWHPINCNPVFFLDFAKEKKRISYAASMGNTKIPPEKEVEFKRMINNFDYISVREEECAAEIRKMTDKPVEVHIDPTFLLDANEWRKIEVPYKIKQPYILLYMLYWDPACKAKIKELKKKTGLPVYAISNGLSRVYADKFLYDVGVEEFLWLIDHAEYVVTSSFHGVALSTILNKKVAAVVNPEAPSRIEHLMRTVSLPQIDITQLDICEIDYSIVNANIQHEQRKSMEYLKRAIR